MEIVGEPMPLKDVQITLNSLSGAAEELNEASDAYTEQLRAIEGQLRASNVGLTVELDKPFMTSAWYPNEESDTGPNEREEHRLSFGKYDDWCFIASRYCTTTEDDEGVRVDQQPLLTCSRDIRMAAAEFVEPLVKEIAKKAKEKTQALKKALG